MQKDLKRKCLRFAPLTMNGKLTANRQLKKPSIRTEEKSLYYAAPPSLEEQTRPNLKRKLHELLADGEEVGVSDPAFTIDFKFKVRFG